MRQTESTVVLLCGFTTFTTFTTFTASNGGKALKPKEINVPNRFRCADSRMSALHGGKALKL
jgi:hypothetical protein